MEYLLGVLTTAVLVGYAYGVHKIANKKYIVRKPTELEQKEEQHRQDHINALMDYDVSKAYGRGK